MADKENIMTRLEKLIGFPVPQEHRKQLKERMETYENCDRTTLISLLLQYDWELMQIKNSAIVTIGELIEDDDRLGDSFMDDFKRRLED